MKRILFALLVFSNTVFAQNYTQIQKLVASDRDVEDRFGWSVYIDGEWAVSGAYADDFGAVDPNMGSVYIYRRTAFNTWVEFQKITNSDQEDYDRFGYNVAIKGDYIVVGAYGEDDDENGNNNMSKSGSAYVFHFDGNSWVEEQKLVASDREAGDEFGWSVDIHDSTIVVGAHADHQDENGMNDIHHAGSVYIFDKDVSGVWQQTQKIVASERAPDINFPNGYSGEDVSDLFGHDVAVWGDYLIVGALHHDWDIGMNNSMWAAGAAYVFERNAGVWIEVQKIQSFDIEAWDRFGCSVAIDTNVIVVGSYSEDEVEDGVSNPLTNSGSIHVFERDLMGVWNQEHKVVPNDRSSGDHFGYSIDLEGNFMVVGTHADDHDEFVADTMGNAGSAYILEYNGTSWNQIRKIDASDRDTDDEFGIAVGLSRDDIIVGAFNQDLDETFANGVTNAGAAYVFSKEICPVVNVTNNPILCFGDSVIVGVNSYNSTGVYIDSFQTAYGCDSIITTNLTVNPVYNHTDSVNICSGHSHMVGNSVYDSTGVYIDTLNTINGCDSIITTTLIVNPPFYFSNTVNICFGENYMVGNNSYDTTGVYHDSLQTVAGCDSIIVTNLIVNQIYNETQNVNLCFGDSLLVGNNYHSVFGTYLDTLNSQFGCDSIVTTNLSFDPQIPIGVSQNGSELSADLSGATYQWLDCDNGFNTVTSGVMQLFEPTQLGNYAVEITFNGCTDTSTCYAVLGINSIKEQTELHINVYPNPNNGSLIIEGNGIVEVSISGLSGKLIYRNTEVSDKINVNGLPNGIYLLHVYTKNNIWVEKIIVH